MGGKVKAAPSCPGHSQRCAAFVMSLSLSGLQTPFAANEKLRLASVLLTSVVAVRPLALPVSSRTRLYLQIDSPILTEINSLVKAKIRLRP